MSRGPISSLSRHGLTPRYRSSILLSNPDTDCHGGSVILGVSNFRIRSTRLPARSCLLALFFLFLFSIRVSSRPSHHSPLKPLRRPFATGFLPFTPICDHFCRVLVVPVSDSPSLSRQVPLRQLSTQGSALILCIRGTSEPPHYTPPSTASSGLSAR